MLIGVTGNTGTSALGNAITAGAAVTGVFAVATTLEVGDEIGLGVEYTEYRIVLVTALMPL